MDFTPLEQFMDRLTDWRIPGNSIVIYKGKNKVFEYSSGYASLETKELMTGEHMLNMYSCSKLVTVVAALQLYERGYFLLSDPIYQFIPEFRNMRIAHQSGHVSWAQHPINMRQLLTMTSGLDYDMNSDGIKKARELTCGRMDTVTVARCIAEEDKLCFEPGEKWMYGKSHEILAAIVEIISGERFSEYVNHNIFQPLGMTEACYHNDAVRHKMAEQYSFKNLSERDIVKLQSTDNSREGGKIINVGKGMIHDLGDGYDSGGAGVTSSVEEFSKFVAALGNGGLGLTGERILASGTIDLMRQNQLSETQRRTFDWTNVVGYGYGLGVRTMINKAESGSLGNLLEFGWSGAAGSSAIIDTDIGLSAFYSHHMLNAQEGYYQPRLRNVIYKCLD